MSSEEKSFVAAVRCQNDPTRGIRGGENAWDVCTKEKEGITTSTKPRKDRIVVYVLLARCCLLIDDYFMPVFFSACTAVFIHDKHKISE
jgi:hypothetical protein